MKYNPSIFKAYDIRGIYPTDINEENFAPIIKAAYKFFHDTIEKKPFTVVLAYDMRLSGPQLLDVAKKTLLDMGANIIDIGQVSTPTFYFAVWHYGYDCGIQITASHNPKEWNGMKLAKRGPNGLIKIGKPQGINKIQEMATNEDYTLPSTTKGTITQKTGILEDEVAEALKLFNNPQLDTFKVVADPANAMGSQYIDALFKKIPGELIRMNFELDGSFPVHQPDPLQFKNLVDLQKRVLEEKADFGLAPDGDGDRLFFIDNEGQVVPATIITAIIAKELLKTSPGDRVYFDIRDIYTPTEIIKEIGGIPEITRVGHAFITEAMNKTGGIFAGESSAHYYYRMNGNGEWQLPTILSVMKYLTKAKKSLSEVSKELSRSFESGEFNFKVSNAQEILDALKEKYKDAEFSYIDGVSIAYSQWRANLRTSNTEPLLRLNVESYKKELMEEKKDEIMTFIKSIAKEIHE